MRAATLLPLGVRLSIFLKGLTRLLSLMDTLGLRNRIDLLIPDQSIRPSAFLERERPRQRARRKKPAKTEWKWGDEE